MYVLTAQDGIMLLVHALTMEGSWPRRKCGLFCLKHLLYTQNFFLVYGSARLVITRLDASKLFSRSHVQTTV